MPHRQIARSIAALNRQEQELARLKAQAQLLINGRAESKAPPKRRPRRRSRAQ